MLFIFLGFLIGILCLCLGFMAGLKYSSMEIIKMRKLASKYSEMLKIAVKWIKEFPEIENFIIKNREKRIAIYGMSYFGECLESAFRKNGVEIVCGIDQNADRLYNPHTSIFTPDDSLPLVDTVIVTAVAYFDEIKGILKQKYDEDVEIISLEELLYK